MKPQNFCLPSVPRQFLHLYRVTRFLLTEYNNSLQPKQEKTVLKTALDKRTCCLPWVYILLGEKLASSYTKIEHLLASIYFLSVESWKVKLERICVINNYSINNINIRGNQLGLHFRFGQVRNC